MVDEVPDGTCRGSPIPGTMEHSNDRGTHRLSLMPVTIYHNPRCQTSRKTLALLEESGVQPTIVEYLETPLSESELKRLLNLLGMTPRELLRTKEDEYKKSKLDRPEVSDSDIIRAMVRHPRLIQRPIVVAGNKACLGGRPENVKKII